MLTGEPLRRALADAIKSLKQGVSRRLIGEAEHFWQKCYYDSPCRSGVSRTSPVQCSLGTPMLSKKWTNPLGASAAKQISRP